ncbi:sigma-70 family RNA polymerase sigma factor [Nocardioides sp. BP30]|uniref:sigma-70 family RNA polymerase sigma factor n=1 Tax=Nocardioides sp. BP30 TaxID=3036374 RepID=UPI002469AB90|nr:sigma-70 family RNA polymerase sigma factor [Nocardioides sp. BP30]WGL51310.1 sigma-70 family RNA polymerase sigma factor [Nocardioides sp. BP30]
MSDAHPSQPDELPPLDEPGDAELISAVRGGDLEAYGTLFERHVDSARRLARQLVSAGDVDDLVSDAFAKVLAVLQRGGGPDLAFRAYLLTSLRRLHVDRLRAGARLTTTDDLAAYDPGVPFEDTAVTGFDNAAAARAFASLPERWQQVLWHTEVEGQKPAEVAPLLGISANSVSALAYRAREGLRQAFISMHAQEAIEDDCAVIRAQLGGYLRGGVSRRDAAKVEDHLATCRECNAIYLELAEVNNDLGAVLAPMLLGSAGAGYLAHLGAVGAAKGGLPVFLDRTRDWVVHHPAGRIAAGATGAVAAAAVVAAVALAQSGPAPLSDARTQPSADAPSTAPPTPQAGASPGAARPPRPTGRASSNPSATAPATTPPASAPAAHGPFASSSSASSGPSHPVIRTPLSPVRAPAARTPVTIRLTKGAVAPDGDPLRVQSARVVRRAHGTVAIDRDGVSDRPLARLVSRGVAGSTGPATSVTYTPDTGWRGTDTIAYVLADAHGRTVSGSVQVTTPDAAPVAQADVLRIPGTWQRGTATRLDVLANDRDENGDPLRVKRVTTPAHGTATVSGGVVRYSPAAGYTGADSFGYTVADGHGGTATASVTVTIGRLPDRVPQVASTTETIAFGEPLTLHLGELASDADGDHLTFATRTQPAHGSLTVAADGTATYLPASGFFGHDSFVYAVSDGRGGTQAATVTVIVQPPVSDLTLSHLTAGVAGYEHIRLVADGIPDGRSATLHLHIAGIAGWAPGEAHSLGGDLAGCTLPAAPLGSLDLTCSVTGDGEMLHLDFDVAEGWSVDASLTPDDFTDDDPGNNTFHRTASTPLGQ